MSVIGRPGKIQKVWRAKENRRHTKGMQHLAGSPFAQLSVLGGALPTRPDIIVSKTLASPKEQARQIAMAGIVHPVPNITSGGVSAFPFE